jgi:hypothetical protein
MAKAYEQPRCEAKRSIKPCSLTFAEWGLSVVNFRMAWDEHCFLAGEHKKTRGFFIIYGDVFDRLCLNKSQELATVLVTFYLIFNLASSTRAADVNP